MFVAIRLWRELTMNTIRGIGTQVLPRGRWPASDGLKGSWPLAGGLILAALTGYFLSKGNWQFAFLMVAAPAFLVAAVATPERTALGLIVFLPFFIYPASVGGFSLFLAVPLFGFTGLMLMTRQRGSLHGLRRPLPLAAFFILLTIAIAAAAASSDPATAFSRVLYLALFGWFAWSLATALMAGRLSREAVAKAIVYSGALAAAAVLIQFLAQFGGGKEGVIEWLKSVQATFAGERAAGINTTNWVISDLNLLRGIFPFMSPPSAGQYLMLTFVAGIWLRRERKGMPGPSSTAELAMLVVIAAGLLATFSRQAWLGALIGVIALGVKRRPLRMLAIVVGGFLVLATAPIPGGHGTFGDYLLTASNTSSTSSATRLGLWGQATHLIPHHALLGVGPGLYSTLNPDPANPIYYAHNVFLDMAIELGVAGAFAFIALMVLALRASLVRSATLAFAMLTAFVVASLFDDVFYTPRNGLMVALAYALIVGQDRVQRRPVRQRPSRKSGVRPALDRSEQIPGPVLGAVANQ